MSLENAERRGSELVNIDLSGVRLRNVDFSGAKVMEATLVNARFSGLIDGLVINDVEVGPLIEAELDRRYPERLKLHPNDAAGTREAWAVIEGLWSASKGRALALPEPLLHERVDDEWSFAETIRHLIFVTDSWVTENILGRADRHPIGVAPSFIPDPEALGLDPAATPTIAEVITVRDQRMSTVAHLVSTLTDEDLNRPCGQGGDHTVLSCLHVLFDEEWAHNWYANRDLDTLTGATPVRR